MISVTWKGTVIVFVAGLCAGTSAGWMLWKPKTLKAETYAPPSRQPDGSLVLERKPNPKAKPAHVIPAGAVVERVASVTVRPLAAMPGPVVVDFTLIRMPDLSHRVIASSPDGEVITGVDIPIAQAVETKRLLWAAGGVYGATSNGGKAVGAFLDRDFGFVRVGAEITRNTYLTQSGWEVRVHAGIRF